MFFNWLSRCWGGMGITTQFQKARINCTIADWTVPYEDDILILITSFQEKNPQIPGKTAINIFLSHLQTDDQKSHPAFLLKHLYVLDHCVQEMTALDTIGYYYNSNLTTMKNSQTFQGVDSKSPLRQLINSYYAYLITKARTFGNYQKTYFSREFKPMQISPITDSSPHNYLGRTKKFDEKQILSDTALKNDYMCTSKSKKRSKPCAPEQSSISSLFEKQTSHNSIFDVIQKCQQLQKHILQMNKAYQSGNRKVQLIKYIFIMCLWTFIRCYIIVSVGMKYLFSHFLSMSLKQLESFIKMFSYFNGEYTADFIRFVETNKNEIEIFREINYNELTYVDKNSMRILLDYKDELKLKEGFNTRAIGVVESVKKSTDFFSPNSFFMENNTNLDPVYSTIFHQLQSQKVMDLPLQVHIKIKENMKIFYKPRKNMDFCLIKNNMNKRINEPYIYEDLFQECQMQSAFFEHQNLYHDSFIVDVSEDGDGSMTKSNQTNSKQITQPITKSRTIKDDSNQSQISPIRKLTIDKDINSIIQDKSGHCVDQLNIKLAKSQLINSSTQKRSMEPIKQSQMREIKEMFRQKNKGSKQYAVWDMWENQYGVNNDLIGMKN